VPDRISSTRAEAFRNYAALTQLIVHPGVRRKGIGTSLLIGVEGWARSKGKAGFWLVTHRIAHWYQRHFGYKEVDRMSVRGIEKRIMVKEFESKVPHPLSSYNPNKGRWLL
jgi:GNAT superfamily N-acetyltransferase